LGIPPNNSEKQFFLRDRRETDDLGHPALRRSSRRFRFAFSHLLLQI